MYSLIKKSRGNCHKFTSSVAAVYHKRQYIKFIKPRNVGAAELSYFTIYIQPKF